MSQLNSRKEGTRPKSQSCWAMKCGIGFGHSDMKSELFIIFKSIHLLEDQCYDGRRRDRKSEFIHQLIYSPDGYKSWDWTTLKLEARSFLSHMWVAEVHLLRLFSRLPLGSWIGKGADETWTGTHVGYSDVVSSGFIHYVKCLPRSLIS